MNDFYTPIVLRARLEGTYVQLDITPVLKVSSIRYELFYSPHIVAAVDLPQRSENFLSDAGQLIE